ncbi:hypothetical protein [Tenacibaculum sp. nBUS_03]|uniref:hypothetical protein n=1 Tax=Tenacibaculum sp. nBUS_03 TaxID=3395320 RepID=UPI003EB88169
MKALKKMTILFTVLMITMISCSEDNSQEMEFNKVSYNSIAEFFEENGVKPQVFTIQADEGGTIVGEEGTEITFPENAFKKSDGTIVNGEVTIKINEIFKASEMILSDKPTNALSMLGEETFLLSEGETAVFAEQGGETLSLAPSKKYSVKVPSDGGDDPDMRSFNGIFDNGGNLVWNAATDRAAAGGFGMKFVAPGSYLYDVFRIGWTNCDKFYSFPGTKTTNYVNLNESPNLDETVVYVVMKENNLPAVVKFTKTYANGVKSYNNSLPVGLELSFIAITIKDNQQYLAIEDKVVAVDEELVMTFNPVSTEEIINTLEGLN